jgi:hypothetical protein
MAIPSSGPIKFSNLQSEFGGSNPINLSEYYRANGRVPDSPANITVPTSGTVALSMYRSTANAFVISYRIIGGGGGGGHGVEDGGSSGRGGSGGTSSISGSGVSVSADGGLGGLNGAYRYDDFRFRAGADSPFGPGGAGGDESSWGSPAPATSYGAGGGGGGGDIPTLFDQSGNSGGGGAAGAYKTGSFSLVVGERVYIKIGLGGAGSAEENRGGDGAAGYCDLTYNGTTYTFYSSGYHTIS